MLESSLKIKKENDRAPESDVILIDTAEAAKPIGLPACLIPFLRPTKKDGSIMKALRAGRKQHSSFQYRHSFE
jgi:hypothetical protein